MDINAFNKKCAEFLEWEKLPYPYIVYDIPASFKFAGYRHDGNLLLEALRFHSDYNWIMFLIEEIQKLGISFKINSQWNEFNKSTYTQVSVTKEIGEMSKDGKAIYNSIKVYEKNTTLSKDKKEVIVEAINNFLDWYLTNK